LPERLAAGPGFHESRRIIIEYGLESIPDDFWRGIYRGTTDKDVSKFMVFAAASAALVVASALGVLAGSLLSEFINEKYLQYAAGLGFIAIGIFTLYRA
jgi:hypothetical protein